MSMLIAAAAFLLITHFGLSSTGLRPALASRLGERRFLALHSVIAVMAFIWLVSAYANAPYRELYRTGPAVRWIPLLVMPFALWLMVAGVITPNPTSVAQEKRLSSEPRGLVRITRHPFMWGVGLLSLSHMAANGDLAAWLLFGTLALLALAGTLFIDAKKARADPDAWARFAARTSNLPFAAIAAGRQRLAVAEALMPGLPIALLLYGALLFAHPWLFGVSPLPH
jgi:uncharacterized membrane protein